MKKNICLLLIMLMIITSCGLENKEPTENPATDTTLSETQNSTDESTDIESESNDTENEPGTEVLDPQDSYTYTEMNKSMYTTGELNVRVLPTKESESLGVLKKNEEVVVTAQCNETSWYRITYKGQVGYISNKYVADKNNVIESYKQKTLYAKSNVNIRSKPDASSTKLGALNANESIIALGDAVNGWQMVLFDNEIAYISAKYLSTSKTEVIEEMMAEDFVVPDLSGNGPLVVIDPGHQGKYNPGKEPIGPGATELKTKVAVGTSGCATGIMEYELTLTVSLMLRDELVSRGYRVVMIREDHDINISNAQRALVANNLKADAFIRIHANGSANSKDQGALTICQTSKNIYNGELYSQSRRLSDCVLEEFAKTTGCVKRAVWETDTMSGINWAKVPTTIVEMGFMSNPTEDKLMATKEYQEKMVEGMANGLDAYFGY